MCSDTDQSDSIACRKCQDVGARHGCFASIFDLGFDGVDDFKPTGRVCVWASVLLTGECWRVVQKDRSITSLVQMEEFAKHQRGNDRKMKRKNGNSQPMLLMLN